MILHTVAGGICIFVDQRNTEGGRCEREGEGVEDLKVVL
jgi:hypothetical protein